MLLPVVVGLTGAEALAVRTYIDGQILRDQALLVSCGDAVSRDFLSDSLILLCILRDKLDVAIADRDVPPPPPF